MPGLKNINGLKFNERKGLMILTRNDVEVRRAYYGRVSCRTEKINQWMIDITNLHGTFAITIIPEI